VDDPPGAPLMLTLVAGWTDALVGGGTPRAYYHHGLLHLKGCISYLGGLPPAAQIAYLPAGFDVSAAIFAQPCEVGQSIATGRVVAQVLVNAGQISLWSQAQIDWPGALRVQYLWLNGIVLIPDGFPGRAAPERAPFPPG
jgi:hypothetical protein